jgi:putative hydrolase of the HAD superfamily
VRFEVVLFDLGGVVFGSPLQAIADYERAAGLARGALGRVIAGGGESGAWSRLETGELRIPEFHAEFARECRAAGLEVDPRALFEAIARESAPRPRMLAALARIRARGLRTAALTNDWAPEDGIGPQLTEQVGPHFDAIFRSSVLGMRKPEPRIYRHVCGALQVEASRVVFLDDIGANLKSARALGMHTIRVVGPDAALQELGEVLGFPLD